MLKQRLVLLCLILAESLPAAVPLQGTPGVHSETAPEAAAEAARRSVLAAADRYRGVRYRYGGVDAQGFDCSGLVFRAFHDALSVSVPRTTGGLFAWAERIDDADVQIGDLLFFKTTAAKTISHVGIYAGNGIFIHSASEGPRTGVIYSALDESYWKRTFAGTGRALPSGTGVTAAGKGDVPPRDNTAGADTGADRAKPSVVKPPDDAGDAGGAGGQGKYRIGIGIAPSWNGFLKDGFPVRGAAAQIRFAAETNAWDRPVLLGLELRPEWDHTLGVFRFPVTLSAGFDDRFRVFAGPSFSFGDAVLKTSGGDRRYSGGSSWLGALGIWAAPVSWNVGGGALSLYGEFAWQSYFSDNSSRNWNADICAGFRFSTGFCYTWKL